MNDEQQTFKRLRFVDPNKDPYRANVRHIQRVAAKRGFDISYEDAKRAWETYSDSMAAGWLTLPESDDHLWLCIYCYFEEVE